MTYYNLVQNFELSEFRQTLHPSPESTAQVFDRPGATVLSFWLHNPVPPQTFVIHTPVPCTVQDVFGRTQVLTPVEGRVLVSVEEKPLTLVFAGKLAAVKIEPMEGGLTAPTLARGNQGTLSVSIPGIFDNTRKVTVATTVDGTWPEAKPQTIELAKGKAGAATLSVVVDSRRETGTYTLSTRLSEGEKTFGLLRSSWRISEELAIAMEGVPLRVGKHAAVKVIVSNFSGQPHTGMVRFQDRWFAAGLRPRRKNRPITWRQEGPPSFYFPCRASSCPWSAPWKSVRIWKTRTAFVSARMRRSVSSPPKRPPSRSPWMAILRIGTWRR